MFRPRGPFTAAPKRLQSCAGATSSAPIAARSATLLQTARKFSLPPPPFLISSTHFSQCTTPILAAIATMAVVEAETPAAEITAAEITAAETTAAETMVVVTAGHPRSCAPATRTILRAAQPTLTTARTAASAPWSAQSQSKAALVALATTQQAARHLLVWRATTPRAHRF